MQKVHIIILAFAEHEICNVSFEIDFNFLTWQVQLLTRFLSYSCLAFVMLAYCCIHGIF